MLDMTPQERTALIVIAMLLVGGAGARHLSARSEARQWLEYSLEKADTLDPARGGGLLQRAETELDLARIRSTPLREGERIDPNSAPPEQLDRLPRVGAALADRIVAHRETHGPFRSLADLGVVSGIGPAVLETISPYLTLPQQGGSAARGGSNNDRVDVNRATAAELQTLPGIGPALADRIVAHRDTAGRFRTLEDLEQVNGIGPRLRERIQDLVRMN